MVDFTDIKRLLWKQEAPPSLPPSSSDDNRPKATMAEDVRTGSTPELAPPANYSHPNLTPQFCFNQTALRDFLRLSRSTLDDTISSHLNALSSPSHDTPFTPLSTRTPSPLTRTSARSLPSSRCQQFTSQILFPLWSTRSDVLTYCGTVATSPDPSDPDALLQEVENAQARERIVDERLDPYSGRYFPRERRTEVLAGVVRNERVVEGIVRERTWRIVRERCGETGGGGWEEEFEKWRRGKEGGKR